MNRAETILVIKELLDKCSFLDGKYLSLVPPTSLEPPVTYYQIHIKANLDSLTEACMREILDSHELTMQSLKNEHLVLISKKQI